MATGGNRDGLFVVLVGTFGGCAGGIRGFVAYLVAVLYGAALIPLAFGTL